MDCGGKRSATPLFQPPMTPEHPSDPCEPSPSESGVALRFPPHSISWPHAPVHRLGEAGTYFVTASTYLKARHFTGEERLGVLHRGLLELAEKFRWQLEAWAVFANHYHFVGQSPPETAESLRLMLGQLHERTAKWLNKRDAAPGRKVWHNYRETQLTFEKSYFARLSYTHHNAVHHGLVKVAADYPWCSAAWFERTATPAQVKAIYSFPYDKLNVPDDY